MLFLIRDVVVEWLKEKDRRKFKKFFFILVIVVLFFLLSIVDVLDYLLLFDEVILYDLDLLFFMEVDDL